jgi:hypothetical protein
MAQSVRRAPHVRLKYHRMIKVMDCSGTLCRHVAQRHGMGHGRNGEFAAMQLCAGHRRCVHVEGEFGLTSRVVVSSRFHHRTE